MAFENGCNNFFSSKLRSGGFAFSVMAAVLCSGIAVVSLPGIAVAANGEVIWGRQTGLGKFMTKKVNLTQPATITQVTLTDASPGFCIKARVPYPENVVCWNVGEPSSRWYRFAS